MAKLTGQSVATSYDQLLIVDNANGISSSLQAIESADTGGSSSALKISTVGIEVDTNFTGTTTATTKGAHIDFDATGITASGQTATNIGLDLDINSNSPTMVGTVVNTGIDMDMVGGTSGTQTNVGIDVNVSGADTNYAALFSGGNVGIGADAPKNLLHVHAADGAPGIITISTGSTSTAVSDNEEMARIEFSGYDSDNTYAVGAKIVGRASGNWSNASANYAGTDLEFFTQDDTTADNNLSTPRMIIDKNGKVGIGTASPGATLDVFTTTSYNNIRLGEDKDNQSTQRGGITVQPYLSAEQATTGMFMYVDGTGGTQDTSWIQLGGGHGSYNAVESIQFYTAADSVTLTGTKVMQLDVNSRISLSNNDLGTSNTVFGKLAGDDLASGGNYNVFIGENAGHENSVGDRNVAIGFNAYDDGHTLANLDNIFIGYGSGGGTWVTAASTGNTAIGSGSMTGAQNGALNNTAVGYGAGNVISTGDGNTLLGKDAGVLLTAGANNVMIGITAGAVSYVDSDNTYIGSDSGAGNHGGSNVAVGKDALKGETFSDATCDYDDDPTITHDANAAIIAGLGVSGTGIPVGAYIATRTDSTHFELSASTTGGAVTNGTLTFYSRASGTTAIGTDALTALTTGAGNTAVGYQALMTTGTGGANTAVGYGAADVLPDGASDNTAIGYGALGAGNAAATDGNTCVGQNSGSIIQAGAQNTCIGTSTDPSAHGGINQTVIGYDATGVADNSVTLGNDDVTAVYMSHDGGAKIFGSQLNIGHGTTASNLPIECKGTASGDAVARFWNDGDNSNLYGIKIQCGADTLSSAGDAVYVVCTSGDGTASGGIRNSSNVDLPEFYEGSDERIKDDIADTKVDALDTLNSLKMREFKKKNNSKKTKIGLVAQEVLESKMPQLVGKASNKGYEDYFDEGETEMYAIGTGEVVYYLIKAVQELSAQVEELKNK